MGVGLADLTEQEKKKLMVDEVVEEKNGIKEVTVSLESSIYEKKCGKTDEKKFTAASSSRTSGPTRRSTIGGWTLEEDKLLAEAVQENHGRNWKKIAEFFPHRTDVQCLHRWQKVLDPDLHKGPWSEEEDAQIIQLVEKYGCKKWSRIAKSLPGRIGKQCRERWHNQLNPAIKRGPWSVEEDDVLIRAHQLHGNKWAEIAKLLPGRSDNGIKNHWNTSLAKRSSSVLFKAERSHGIVNDKALLDRKQTSCPHRISSPEKWNLGFSSALLGLCKSDINDFGHSNASDSSCEANSSQEKPCGPRDSSDSLPSYQSHETQEREDGHIFTISRDVNSRDEMLETGADIFSSSSNGVSIQTPCTPRYICNNSTGIPGELTCLNQQSCIVQNSCASLYSTSPELLFIINDTESILREAARSFKNTPSIIRKRKNGFLMSSEAETPQQSVVASEDSGSLCCGSVDTTLRLGLLQSVDFNNQQERDYQILETTNSVIICHEDQQRDDQILETTSSVIIHHEDQEKSQIPPSKRFKGKKLEHEFDKEWARHES